jgi:2-methylcitrate dehydratase PrpD
MSDHPEYLDKLTDFVCGLRLDELGADAVAAARTVTLDTIGAMTAGSCLPENRKLAEMAVKMSGVGASTIIGHSELAGPSLASLVNGTSGVALEMDEGNRLGGGHAAIHVIPPALAVAEETGASGREFLESVIAAYEVTSRIGTGTVVRSEVHSHGTWGTVGAAAATGRLLGLSRAELREAINIAASMSPANTWTPCIEGATVRNLYSGRSAMQGIMAANLVLCGFTGIKDGPADIYGSLLGQGFDPEAVSDGLGGPGPLRIQQNYFKLHACCLYNHPALDGMQNILRREAFAATDVDRIEVLAPPLASIMTDPAPPNMLAAKFSLPYAVASTVTQGTTDVTAFYQDKLDDEATLSLAQRVSVAADPEMDLRRYDYPAARVTVSLRNGRSFSESVVAHHGDHRNPASPEELQEKFAFLTEEALGSTRAREVMEAVARIEDLPDIRELSALLRGR